MLLHHRFVNAAKRRGSKLALVDATFGIRLTYRQALMRALVLSRRFATLEPGFVGIMLPNTAATVLAMLGVLLAGRVPVMINFTGGAADACRMAQRRCGFRTIITSRALCERLECPPVDGMVFLEDLRESMSVRDRLLGALTALAPTAVVHKAVHQGSADDIAVVLFTSGSEKEPKAVPLTHRNISTNVDSLTAALGLRTEDIFLANLPFFHVFGQTGNIWTPLASEMTLVTVANPLDFRGTCDTIRREGVTLVAGTPTLFWGYLRASKEGDFAACRICMTGADKCPEPLHEAFHEKHGQAIYEAYGATETSPAVSMTTPTAYRRGSVGRPVGGVRVRIQALDTDAACAPGEHGRILVHGSSVMHGYHGDAASTSAVLRDGWYDTGDMGYLDGDGYLWLTGRLRRFVKIGGEMVSLLRIEDALHPLLPPGAECCVVDVPDEFRGSQIVAVVTQPVAESVVRDALAATLPLFSVPARFVVVPDLRKSATGKIDFRGVEEQARAALAG